MIHYKSYCAPRLRVAIACLAIALAVGGCAVPPQPQFHLVDKRHAAEREGFPYPKSHFKYTMHGDQSLEVDRLQIIRTRLAERFGKELAGKTVTLHKFSVLEAMLRNSFVKDATGKSVRNTGPYEPRLVGEFQVEVESRPYGGSSELTLSQPRATHQDLAQITNLMVDKILTEMATDLARSKN